MNTAIDTSPSASKKTTVLWVAIGVLGLAVLAMGATLLRTQNQATEPPTVAISTPTQAAAPAPVALAEPAASVPPALAASALEIITESAPVAPPEKPKQITQKKTVAHANKAQAATTNVANKNSDTNPNAGPQPVQPQTPEPAVARASAKPVCANCGTVERVTPIERDGNASGVGVVAGGVLGAVVGNQVGGGSGKTLATILGAVGGGVAGNAVEKKMKKVTQYQVTVRMEDGSTRSVEQATPASVGEQVTVDGNTLHSIHQ